MLFHKIFNTKKLFSDLRFDDKPLQAFFIVALQCVILFFVFCIFFKYAESSTWEESVWQGWQTFTTVGYGNAPAETTLGRVVTILFSTLGIAFVGALFSTAFDYKEFLKDLDSSRKCNFFKVIIF